MSISDHLQAILGTARDGAGMDVVIVSTTSPDLAAFWQQRLDLGRGAVCRPDALVLAIHEDWPGGAGNGLGTLHAWREASRLARERHGVDLSTRLDEGAAIGLYHTAGQGTRLAPLPGSEGGNKSAVKLPGLVRLEGRVELLTILEAVIRQTSVYARSHRGRLGVFWGDQVFVPSAPLPAKPRHHVEILARLGAMPTADAWLRDGLDRYGLVAVGRDGDAVQVEKVSHAAAEQLVADGVMRVDGGIGVSLGSFSLSAAMTAALDAEFDVELRARTAKLDTDPHFWMPLTLPAATYRRMMAAKGVAADLADLHHRRLAAFLARFRDGHPGEPVFGCLGIGAGCYWWDYGTIPGYLANVRRLLGDDDEARSMRSFLGVDADPGAVFRDGSLLLDCSIGEGTAAGSVLVGVTARRVDVVDSVLVNVTAPEVSGRDLLLYNVVEPGRLAPPAGAVRADLFLPDDRRLSLWSRVDRDGKQDWEAVLPGNELSHAGLCDLNATLPLAGVAAALRRNRERLAGEIAADPRPLAERDRTDT